ncbi:MAG: tRNA preQ1(34) S-adenosylmethionine ribosyltransferase-isomerase QueA, partial [Candidatus Muproteobacteria bacterium RBG_16_64_10]
MRTSDFRYDLPDELIACYPAEPRGASRLLILDSASGGRRDLTFADFPSLLRRGDLLVFNDTRVIPARLFGAKQTGGRIEVLIERVLDTQRVIAQVRASKAPKPGQWLDLDGDVRAQVVARRDEFFELAFEPGQPVLEAIERIGHVPLPPYIARADEPSDRERYQTVYARHPGAVAAPTAGLHFEPAMLDRLQAMGVEFGHLTLHVGAGTFQPPRTENLTAHRMHAEHVKLDAGLCA